MENENLLECQLTFDYSTGSIVDDDIDCWITMEEVPKYIKDWILDTSMSRVIRDSDTKEYYCCKCLGKLDEYNCCSKCFKQFEIPSLDESKYIIDTSVRNIKDYTEYTRYFVFDVVKGQVLLYVFRVYTSYCHHVVSYWLGQLNKIEIEHVYRVNGEGLFDYLTNEEFLFDDYCKDIDENCNYDLLEMFNINDNNNYLYTDNLNELKNTLLYKYTSIWELKEFFKVNSFSLSALTFNPICCKQFEYLVKMKLYCLAVTVPHHIEYKKSFKETFGVDKKYYSFMRDIDINYYQLSALRVYPTTDINLINFMSYNTELFEKLKKYAPANKIKMYFDGQKLDGEYIYEYSDYISCCVEMGYNMNDKQILFPKNFIEQHNKITSEMIIAENPKINKRIQSLAKVLEINKYEDEQYVIFPADSVYSLIDESSQMSNCVRTYCEKISNNECQIYFMRNKSNINKSLVTIEVINGKIVQARAKYNEIPSKQIKNVLQKWEKQIVAVTN